MGCICSFRLSCSRSRSDSDRWLPPELRSIHSVAVHKLAIRRQPGRSIRSISPGGSPQKGVKKEYKEIFLNFSLKFRVLKLRFLAFSEGPGGFRELREAGRNHFHLSWYLLVPRITSYARPVFLVFLCLLLRSGIYARPLIVVIFLFFFPDISGGKN